MRPFIRILLHQEEMIKVKDLEELDLINKTGMEKLISPNKFHFYRKKTFVYLI